MYKKCARHCAMTRDEFIDDVLHERRYVVDPGSGRLVRGDPPRPIGYTRSDNGYSQVTLYAVDGCRRHAYVHRVVAMAVWGRQSIRARHVAHRDRTKNRNESANLWVPATTRDHFIYDGRNPEFLNAPKKCRERWGPCAQCGDPDGPIRKRERTPSRVSGRLFGVDGKICWRCYLALYEPLRPERRR